MMIPYPASDIIMPKKHRKKGIITAVGSKPRYAGNEYMPTIDSNGEMAGPFFSCTGGSSSSAGAANSISTSRVTLSSASRTALSASAGVHAVRMNAACVSSRREQAASRSRSSA